MALTAGYVTEHACSARIGPSDEHPVDRVRRVHRLLLRTVREITGIPAHPQPGTPNTTTRTHEDQEQEGRSMNETEPSAERPDIEYRENPGSDRWVLAMAGASKRDIETARRENERRGWAKYRFAEVLPESLGEPSGSQVDAVAVAIAVAANADYWTDEIAEWENAESWEREAYPDNYPSTAYEDREEFRKQARAALRAASEAGGTR